MHLHTSLNHVYIFQSNTGKAKEAAKKKITTQYTDLPMSFLRGLDMSTRIALLQMNPKQLNRKTYDRYDIYKTATTLKDYLDRGGTFEDLRFDFLHNYVFFRGENAKFLYKKMECEIDREKGKRLQSDGLGRRDQISVNATVMYKKMECEIKEHAGSRKR